MSKHTVGIALGSGGAKGFAHIGVLKALEAHGVVPDIIVGSSMGSLIGAFYATGMKPPFMERLASSLSLRHWLDITVPKVGLIQGQKIHHMVTLLTRGLTFADVPTKLGVVATELTERKSVVFTEGKISDAVRASISIPGVFVPYVRNDGIYVDGGVLDRVPVEAVRALGATRVISVDVAANARNSVPETIMDVIWQSLDLMQQPVIERKMALSDVYITPELSTIGTSQFQRAREAIDIGYQAALDAMDKVLPLLEVEDEPDVDASVQ